MINLICNFDLHHESYLIVYICLKYSKNMTDINKQKNDIKKIVGHIPNICLTYQKKYFMYSKNSFGDISERIDILRKNARHIPETC